MKKRNPIKKGAATTRKLEERSDSGEGVLDLFDTSTKRVGVDLPPWAIKALDREAAKRGITRQALVKAWLVDRLDALEKASA